MKYIVLDVLLCSIAEYFYELCRNSREMSRKLSHIGLGKVS